MLARVMGEKHLAIWRYFKQFSIGLLAAHSQFYAHELYSMCMCDNFHTENHHILRIQVVCRLH